MLSLVYYCSYNFKYEIKIKFIPDGYQETLKLDCMWMSFLVPIPTWNLERLIQVQHLHTKSSHKTNFNLEYFININLHQIKKDQYIYDKTVQEVSWHFESRTCIPKLKKKKVTKDAMSTKVWKLKWTWFCDCLFLHTLADCYFHHTNFLLTLLYFSGSITSFIT